MFDLKFTLKVRYVTFQAILIRKTAIEVDVERGLL